MRTEEKEVEAEKSLCLILCFYPSQQSVLFIDFMVCVHEIQRELCMQKIVSPMSQSDSDYSRDFSLGDTFKILTIDG